MRLHARESVVTKAEIELRQALAEWGSNQSDLTTAEYLKILLNVTNERVQSLLKIEIRLERHGDADKPGGAE